MEKVKATFESQVATLVEVTPAQLRQLANLLELSSTNKCTGTETALVGLTDRITLVYEHKNTNPTSSIMDKLINKDTDYSFNEINQ